MGFFGCIVLFLSTTDTYNETTNSTAEDLPYQSGKCRRPILRNPFKGAGLPWPFLDYIDLLNMKSSVWRYNQLLVVKS